MSVQYVCMQHDKGTLLEADVSFFVSSYAMNSGASSCPPFATCSCQTSALLVGSVLHMAAQLWAEGMCTGEHYWDEECSPRTQAVFAGAAVEAAASQQHLGQVLMAVVTNEFLSE